MGFKPSLAEVVILTPWIASSKEPRALGGSLTQWEDLGWPMRKPRSARAVICWTRNQTAESGLEPWTSRP